MLKIKSVDLSDNNLRISIPVYLLLFIIILDILFDLSFVILLIVISLHSISNLLQNSFFVISLI